MIAFLEPAPITVTPCVLLDTWRNGYRLKRCGNNNKDEDNSPKNLNDKNQQASSQKFRQKELCLNFALSVGFRICLLYPLQRSETPTKKGYPRYTKLHPILGIWGVWTTLLWLLLPGPLFPGVVVPLLVPYINQINLLNNLFSIRPFTKEKKKLTRTTTQKM